MVFGACGMKTETYSLQQNGALFYGSCGIVCVVGRVFSYQVLPTRHLKQINNTSFDENFN